MRGSATNADLTALKRVAKVEDGIFSLKDGQELKLASKAAITADVGETQSFTISGGEKIYVVLDGTKWVLQVGATAPANRHIELATINSAGTGLEAIIAGLACQLRHQCGDHSRFWWSGVIRSSSRNMTATQAHGRPKRRGNPARHASSHGIV